MTKLKIISILAGFALVLALGFWIFAPSPILPTEGEGNADATPSTTIPTKGEENSDSLLADGEGVSYGGSRFIHPSLGFSFEIPEGFRVTSIEDERGEVILAEGNPSNYPLENGEAGEAAEPPTEGSPSTSSGTNIDGGSTAQNRSFQIFIVPFDEEGPLTPQQIKKDLPQMVMKNIRNARIGIPSHQPSSPTKGGGSPETPSLNPSPQGGGNYGTIPSQGGGNDGTRPPLDWEGGGGAPALVFESEDSYIGPTFEVWFVYPESPAPHGNYLYQITSSAEFGVELSKILQTWRF